MYTLSIEFRKRFALILILLFTYQLSSAQQLRPEDMMKHMAVGGSVIEGDLASHRYILKDGKMELLVNRGSPEAAIKYYQDINKELEISSDFLKSDLNQLLAYSGFNKLSAATLETTPSAQLIKIPGVNATVFFAPKIVDVSGQTQPKGYGWRKLVHIVVPENSAASKHNIKAMWLLFNYASNKPKFPEGRAAQIQVMLESKASGNSLYPIYFFVYENNRDGYTLRLFLNASFDAATSDPNEKYYVPVACAQCHGDTNPTMTKVKLNYMDTDHWFDRTEPGDDFPKMPKANVLPDGGAPGSEQYERAFNSIREMNSEIAIQNRHVDPNSFQYKAALLWIYLHRQSGNPISPFLRSIPGAEKWNEADATDRELLPLLNQTCFRCHSSLSYHVFDKTTVKQRSFVMQSLINSGSMPQDRKLDEAKKANFSRLLTALRNQSTSNQNKINFIETRLESVRRILNVASGNSNPFHEGKRRFWDLPRDEFVNATIYGQKVIILGEPENSALIKSLRGIKPFDGTQFPVMPIGRPRVDESSIRFIENWILDGAPDSDSQTKEMIKNK